MSGVSPNTLKRATIQPHFKTGSKTDVNNYRPTSILPAFGKIFQNIMKIKNLDSIEIFKVLREIQFGTRNRRSTVDALVNVVENVKLEKEKGNNSTMVFLDLKKEFDNVNHSLLLKKLENYGFRCQVLSWFSSYLKPRTQCSVLRPSLFILYFIDLVVARKLSTPTIPTSSSKEDQLLKN